MAFEPKDGNGALFKNTRKESDNHPDYTGNAMVNGEHVDIAAWIKEGKNGKFMSLSFKPPRQRGQEPRQESKPAARQPFDDSDPLF